jgi:toxin YoeB
MGNIVFTSRGWSQYQSWIEDNNRRVLKKMKELIADIDRNGNAGIGKPEPLQGDMEGKWSRRITDEHRLVYKIEDEDAVIFMCRNHYN